jgi:hypothetical protein
MLSLICLLLLGSIPAYTFEIEKAGTTQISQVGNLTTVEIQGTRYLMWSMLDDVESKTTITSTVPEVYKDDFAQLSAGEAVDVDEATKLLDAYYHEYAFDYDAVKIRALQVGGVSYAVRCTYDSLNRCTTRDVRVANLVSFEVNSKNRQGGMTGFENRMFLIAKISKGAVPNKLIAVSDPGRIPPPTFEDMKNLLGNGVALPINLSVDDALAAARAVLQRNGYSIKPSGDPQNEVWTLPRQLKLTSKEADCGKKLGLGYIGEKRTETFVVLKIAVDGNNIRGNMAVSGIQRLDMPKMVGGGAADNALKCSSTGVVEREIVTQIAAR